MKAGIKDNLPIEEDCSMAGTIKLHMDAATITPAANPVSARRTVIPRSLRSRKTHADPAVVPIKGINNPIMTLFKICIKLFPFYNVSALFIISIH